MKIYKTSNLFATLLVLVMMAGMGTMNAQKKKRNEMSKISYQVNAGPVFPIQGDSYQLDGEIGIDDETGELESLGFDVLLNSFSGMNSEYLAWVGNSFNNPEMNFKGKSITKLNDTDYVVKGRLKFRMRYAPVEINLKKRYTDNQIILEGEFRMNTRDYFIISPSIQQVPAWIPFKLKLVLDQYSSESGQLIS